MKSIREYHEATKHSWEKLYQNQHVLVWSNQPNPFRTYVDCPKIDLGNSFEKMHSPLSYVWPFTHNKPRNNPVTLNTLSTLLYYSMSISAWKSYPGVEPWSLRVNPSSGDLHPTETHLYIHNVKDIPSGAYHYFVKDHQLEQRVIGDIVPILWERFDGISKTPPIIIGLHSIFWREAWKYQSRALRYCYLDVGHAMASIMVAAHALGFFVLFVGAFNDDSMRQYLCFDKTDEQLLLFLIIDSEQPIIGTNRKEFPKIDMGASTYTNRLSRKEADYPLIRLGHVLTGKKYRISIPQQDESFVEYLPYVTGKQGMKIGTATSAIEYSLKWTIRHRRSAIDFDGRTTLPLSAFHILMRLLCTPYKADFLIYERPPLVVPYLYVHRIEGLEKGIYCLDRAQKRLLLISGGDMQYSAKELSLDQDIAGDSAFAISFLSNFDYAIQVYGDRGYRYIHYEAGFLGQALYLGATAMGYDATGIGAFFDDDVHTFLKTPSEQQVIYHFTVGKRADDPRISALPAYNHLHDFEEDIK
ncbi:MAG: SagB/ThcOx family dehydrogenase [Candidatus Jettenia sp.]|nr:SagB/ThcOx family dehydrogenase [Candidatus Jettenia sp.]